MLLIITGESGSGKTTLGKHLENYYGFKSLYNYTTRQPRYGGELDEYIFLDKITFKFKLLNGDFIEAIKFKDNYYALGRFVPNNDESKYYVILTPEGRDQLIKELKTRGKDYGFGSYYTIFLNIDKETKRKRLEKRGDKEEDIKKRMNENFEPLKDSIIVEPDNDIRNVVKQIKKFINI